MRFNTAVLYDIENLLKGYNFSQSFIDRISLKEIYESIEKVEKVGNVAIQRAYANWSDPRLNVMKGDIVELGIDPIQIFGFSRGVQKNAADIQLAIDAIDLAHTKLAIEVFVVVSGDGGFASLAKKLHEYGKIVVGCAYKKSANRILEAVCDDFVWINDPDDMDEEEKISRGSDFKDPILIKMSKMLSPVKVENKEQMVSESKKILNWFYNDKECQYLLRNTGLNISIVKQALVYRMPEFNYLKLGFVKYVNLLRFICNGTKLCVVYKAPSEYRISCSATEISGFTKLEPIEEGNIHTTEKYRQLLLIDHPIFRLPSESILVHVAERLTQNRTQDKSIGYVLDMLDNNLLNYEQKSIKHALFSFVSANCFERNPEEAPISEQKFTLKLNDPDKMIEKLKEEMRNKLINLLGEIDEDVFNDIFLISSGS
ncbi:NYN domain-containing protein [Desulfonema magnum]|uniref:NYN domain-containing protein n=1 Tax=Desulfonema magnum TaxID=45655 RepID=A0A975BL84_9BACT|nr:NYN domain-containing protein [Desulfonema magnum]QTA87160.1 NYN domain-containing protein [Desulfonema magnum]